MTADSNRRQFSRVAFQAPARLVSGRGEDEVVVVDLSLRGALLRQASPHSVQIGDNCSLRVRLGALDASIRMQGTIAHREGPLLGLACHDIDLDSATHLRRLVELNLGDSALLERELGALLRDD